MIVQLKVKSLNKDKRLFRPIELTYKLIRISIDYQKNIIIINLNVPIDRKTKLNYEDTHYWPHAKKTLIKIDD